MATITTTALDSNMPVNAVINTVHVPALGAAVDAEEVVMVADKAYKILSAGFIPDTVLTGSSTTNRSLGFVNKGIAGTDTTAIITAKAYDTGVNVNACCADELVKASDAKSIAENEVITFKSTHGSTGLARPAGLVFLVLWSA